MKMSNMMKLQKLVGIWVNKVHTINMKVNTSKNKVLKINEKRERLNNREQRKSESAEITVITDEKKEAVKH